MDVKEYCNNVTTELNVWKSKMYDVARKFEKLSEDEKGKYSDQINNMNSIIDDLDKRIEKLTKECPTSWEPEEKEINEKMEQLKASGEVWDPLHIGV
jgi:Txe/YoeB family toxin of Txe-Axe toxin-antitoxin module